MKLQSVQNSPYLILRKFLVSDFSKKILNFPHCEVATFGTNSSLSNDCFLSESFGAFAEMAIILLSLFRVFTAKKHSDNFKFLTFLPKTFRGFYSNFLHRCTEITFRFSRNWKSFILLILFRETEIVLVFVE